MNSPITCFTALIDIAEDEQCEELEGYLRSKGSEISSSPDTELLQRLQQIIEQCPVVFEQKDLPQQEVEAFFYSVLSLFHIISSDRTKEFVDLFCSKLVLSGNTDNAPLRLKLLGLMFCHFPAKDSLRFTVLCHRVKLASQTGLASSLQVNIEEIRKWVELWKLENKEKRELYSSLWEAHKETTNKTLPTQILTELLKTYTEQEEASQVSQLAEKLVVLTISDPTQFVFDHLLSLTPITALEGQKTYQLLNIFVKEKLSDFVQFSEANKDYITSLGLDYDFCVHKMRQLTLTSLSVEMEQVPMALLRQELDLEEGELEMFVLEAIRMKLIEARINQVQQKLVIMSSLHRTFEVAQWQLLHDRLSSWQQSIQSVKSGLQSIKT